MDFLRDLLNENKERRENAEAAFKQSQSSHPRELCLALLEVSDPQLSSLSLVLLRQTLKVTWSTEGEKVEIGKRILASLKQVPDENRAKKLIEALVAIPQPILGGFSETVVSILDSSRLSLILADAFAEFSFSEKIIGPFSSLVMQVLSNDSFPARDRLLGVKTGVSLVLACEDPTTNSIIQQLASSIPVNAVRIVANAITKEEDESNIEDAMEALASLSDACGWALDATLGESCSMLLDVCENSEVSQSIRSISMTVFGSVMARKASSAGKDSAFLLRTIQCILKLQVDDEEFETSFDATTTIDEDDILGASQNGPRGSGLDALSQLAYGSAGKKSDANNLLNAIFIQVKPLLASPNWKLRVAALSSISMIAAPLEAVMVPHVAEIVTGACKMLVDDSSPRVRLASCACIFSLLDASKKIGKEIRKNLHSLVITAVVTALSQNEAKDPAVVRCGILLALSKFYGGVRSTEEGNEEDDAETVFVPKAAINPYLEGLVQTLVQVLHRSLDANIQIRAMECLAALGTRAKGNFGQYYNILVPGIKQALQQTQDTNLKTTAMMLVATCAETVGKEIFANDAVEVVGWFLERHRQKQIQTSCSKDETSELQGLFNFCQRVAHVLKQDFAPFLPHVLPLVCEAAKADLGISVAENNTVQNDGFETDEHSGQATAVAKLRGVGKFEISANIYAFQLRESALTLLDALAESGSLSREQLEVAIAAVLPNISDRMCTAGLNVAAADAAGSLFNAACDCDVPTATKVLVSLGTPLLSGLAFLAQTPYSSDEMDRRGAFASTFERITRISHLTKGNVKIPKDLLPHVMEVLINAIAASIARRVNWMVELKAQGFENEVLKGYGEDIVEEETELASNIVDSIGYMLKNDSANVWPFFESKVLTFMVGFVDLETSGDVNLTHNALCCFVDALEFGPEDVRVAQACIPNLSKALFSDDPKLRQLGAFGLGVCAQRVTSSSDWIDEVGRALIRCLNLKDAKEESMTLATENVASALGKLFIRTKNNEYLKSFLSQLPFVEDREEAVFAHTLLFSLVLEKENGQSGFEKIILETSARLLQNRAHPDEFEDLCNDETFSKIPQILASAKTTLGQASYAKLVSTLSSEIDQEVKTFMANI